MASLFGWLGSLSVDNWLGLLGSVLSALVALAGIWIAATLAHDYAVRQARLTHNTTIRSDRLKREITALERVWALLAYMSDKKSAKAIIHWRKDSQSGGGKEYCFHFGNLEQFCLREVNEVFYAQHAGLFISAEVRDLLYGYRAVAMGFYFAHKDDASIPEDQLIRIEKPEQAEKLKAIYDDLNSALRTELDERYAALTE